MDWNARLYNKENHVRQEVGIRLIERAGVRPKDLVLDIGCGTGTLTAELAMRADKGRVVGLDPSEDMLAAARQKAKGFKNISLINAKAEELTIASEFTLAYSSNALQWVLDQETAIKNIHAALVPHGRLAVQLPGDGFSHALVVSIWDAITRLGLRQFGSQWVSPWFLPTPEAYEQLLQKTGFREISVMTERFDLDFKSSTDALEWALSAALLPFLARMDESEAERFKYAVCMNFEQYRSDKGIAFDFKRVIALAKKPAN